MPRRRQSSLIEGLFEIAITLPWKLNLISAIFFFLLLHWYVGTEIPPVDINSPSQSVVAPLFRMLATIGQYLLPAIFILGALFSFLKKSKARNLHSRAEADSSGNAIRNMSWRDFEIFIGELFNNRGYSVTDNGGIGAEAKNFAKDKNIDLIDGEGLSLLLKNLKTGHKTSVSETKQASKSTEHPHVPNCPICKGSMVKRKASRGSNAGNEFWGCLQYPKCRGTINI